jgi:hypothetical protein
VRGPAAPKAGYIDAAQERRCGRREREREGGKGRNAETITMIRTETGWLGLVRYPTVD